MAASASKDESFSFNPSNDLLIDCYLRAKIDGKLSHLANAAYFVDADICSAPPQELVRAHAMPARVPPRDAPDCQQFYFFSPARFVGSKLEKKKRSRTIDGTGDKETWHAEGRPKPVEGSSGGGFMTKFSYHVKIGPKLVEKPGWIMTEYSMDDTREGNTVLCKVYKSPRGPGKSCKRKAADDLEAATRSTRQRQTNEDEDDVMPEFVQEVHTAAPQFGEAQDVEESPQEQQMVPASFDSDIQEPESVEFCFDYEEFFRDHAAASDYYEVQNVEQTQPAPQFASPSFEGNCTSQNLMIREEEDGMTLLVPDGGDSQAYFRGIMFGNTEPQDGDVITVPTTDATVDELLLDQPAPEALW